MLIKETHTLIKEPIYVKKAPYTSKEAHISEKRPAHTQKRPLSSNLSHDCIGILAQTQNVLVFRVTGCSNSLQPSKETYILPKETNTLTQKTKTLKPEPWLHQNPCTNSECARLSSHGL